MEITFHVIVLIVAAYAILRGWRLGFIQQMGGVLGLAFGCVTAHVFYQPAVAFFDSIHLWPIDNVAASFSSSLLGAASVYAITYAALWCFGRLLANALSLLDTGVLDSIFGATFCMVKYLLALSIFFNFAIAVNPSSMLLKYARDDDGNIVEGVMYIAPYLIGCESFDELAHRIQLREAKKISCNFLPSQNVCITDTCAEQFACSRHNTNTLSQC